MMTFSTGTGLERVGIDGPTCWLWTLRSPTKTRNNEDRWGSPVAATMLKSVISCRKKKINCLESECSAYLSPMWWPGIYSRCFSQLDDDKDSLLLDEGFSVLIVVSLIRDN